MGRISEAIAELSTHQGYEKIFVQQAIHFRIPGADAIFKEAFSEILPGYNHLEEYDQIISWLSDNHGRGLFLYGNCGRGKSIICQKVLPAILLSATRKIVSQYDQRTINKCLDEILTKKIIGLDEVGTEDEKVDFGNRRWAFPEIMDVVEKEHKLIIITTNLDANMIQDKYGLRTYERIIATTKPVLFRGESLRR